MKKNRILIVDDDLDILAALTAILENADYEVISADSKKTGMEKLKSEKPDLAVLDVMMETTQAGFELTREIRQIEGFEELPVIMLTSVGDITGVNFQAAMSNKDWLPADAYIEKPVEPEELLEEIENLLEK
jgi:DNA-binding response OmpR family regulator